MKKQKRITCPYCGSPAILRDGKYVYGKRSKGEQLYVCKNYPECDSYVTVHRGTQIPMGILANAELRNKRIRAHRLLREIWKNGLMTKKETYRWIGYIFGIPCKEAHIGSFSDYRCELLMEKCRELLVRNCIAIPAGAA